MTHIFMETQISHVTQVRYLFVKPLVTYKAYIAPLPSVCLMFNDKPFDYIKPLNSYISN